MKESDPTDLLSSYFKVTLSESPLTSVEFQFLMQPPGLPDQRIICAAEMTPSPSVCVCVGGSLLLPDSLLLEWLFLAYLTLAWPSPPWMAEVL